MSFLLGLRPFTRIKIPFSSTWQFINKSKPRQFASRAKYEEINEDKPLEYLTSNAAKWKAESSRTQGREPILWYQPIVVCGSVAAFLIYFCILREENDVDEELGTSLYVRIPGLERQHLLQLYEHNLNNGLDVTEVENRLKELLREEKNAKQKAASSQ